VQLQHANHAVVLFATYLNYNYLRTFALNNSLWLLQL